MCVGLLPKLLQVIENPNSKAPSLVTVTDNAMSAVARIAMAFPHNICFEQVVPHWIRGLPVLHDEEEAPVVYRWLLTLLSSGQVDLVLGTNRERVKFVADGLRMALNHSGLLSEELTRQAQAALNVLGA